MRELPENFEHPRSGKKKKTGRPFGLLLFLLGIILVLLCLMFYLGKFGTGGYPGQSGESGTLIASGGAPDSGADPGSEDLSESGEFPESGTEPESEPEFESESETQITILDITVMGSVYLYENQEISLEDLLTEIQIQPDSSIIQIRDDNATQNAMEDLLDELETAGMTYALH